MNILKIFFSFLLFFTLTFLFSVENTESIRKSDIPKWEDSVSVDKKDKVKLNLNEWEPVIDAPRWEDTKPVFDDKSIYNPKKQNWDRLKKAFSGDPLAVFEPNQRIVVERALLNYPDNAELEKKRWVLAAYYCQMQPEDFIFILENLDSMIKRYEGSPMNINDAFSNVQKRLVPQYYYSQLYLQLGIKIFVILLSLAILWVLYYLIFRKKIFSLFFHMIKTIFSFLCLRENIYKTCYLFIGIVIMFCFVILTLRGCDR